MSAAADTAVPARAVNAEQAGRRVEEVLDRLAATGDQEVCEAAEELVRVLIDFYGAGLARIVKRLETAAPQGKGGPLAGLLADDLVSSLLVLHDLHPEDTETRIARALDSVRDQSAEVVGFDAATGTLRLRSAGGGGCGCASTGAAAKQAFEDSLACFAPEVKTVELEQETASPEPALLQIRTGPPTAAAPRRAAAEAR